MDRQNSSRPVSTRGEWYDSNIIMALCTFVVATENNIHCVINNTPNVEVLFYNDSIAKYCRFVGGNFTYLLTKPTITFSF